MVICTEKRKSYNGQVVLPRPLPHCQGLAVPSFHSLVTSTIERTLKGSFPKIH
jgi:hypothetical protein